MEEAVVIQQDNDSIDPGIGDCSGREDEPQSPSRHVPHADKQEPGAYYPHLGENAIAHISVPALVDRWTFDAIDDFSERFEFSIASESVFEMNGPYKERRIAKFSE
jgi:hypothetical protein